MRHNSSPMKLFIAAVALFAGAAAGVLVAQNTKAPQAPAKVTYMSAEQIAEALAKGGPARDAEEQQADQPGRDAGRDDRRR